MPRHGSGGGNNWWDYPQLQGFFWSPSATSAHSGIDLSTPVGTPITAPMDGQILTAGNHPWGGQVDELVTIGGKPYVISWLHLGSETVQAGQQVKKGDVLGYSGKAPSGYYHGGPGAAIHTHFELTYGSTPPYTGYNPHHPTSESYPINPGFFLAALSAGAPPGWGTLGNLGEQTAPGGCHYSVSLPAGITLCMDGAMDLTARGALMVGGFILVIMAFILFASGTPQVQQAGKQAGGKVAEAIGLAI